MKFDINALSSTLNRVDKELKENCTNCYMKIRVLKNRFLAFSRRPGGFRELREAGRNHFHLSWYLLVPGVPSYSQKPWGELFLPGTV